MWLVVSAGVVLAVSIVYVYNSLVKLKVRAENAWSDIDVQLKRRHELIPNLMEAVKGYAAHEQGVLNEVARLRAGALGASGPAESGAAEASLAGAVKSVFAVAEAYPELRADGNFRQLQTQLADIENNIQYARRYFNAVVRDMNTAVARVPSNIVAGLFGFRRMAYFQAEQDAREAVKVDMGAGRT